MYFNIVYSALHTGTWLTCGLIRTVTSPVIPKSDGWLKEISTKYIEDFSDKPLDQNWKKEFVNIIPDHYFPSSGNFLLQSHHRNNISLMYQNLLVHKPTIKIIIPVRDPLLSINSRIWRERGSLEAFQKEEEPFRVLRVKDQLDSFFDLIKIPKEHVFFLPIDTEAMADEEYRSNYCRKMLDFCELKPNNKFDKAVKEWGRVNNTNGGKYPQKAIHRFGLDDPAFEKIRQAIIDKDLELTETYLDFEINYLKEIYSDYIGPMKELGYKNLLWF